MRVSRLRRVSLGVCLLSCTSWVSLPACAQGRSAADTAPQRTEAVGCGSSEEATPNGLAAVLPPGAEGYKSGNLDVLKNRFLSGVAVQINWSDIEPVQGKPDWSKLDALFAAAAEAKKWVQLDIFPGFRAPEWAMAGAKTDMFNIPYGRGHGTQAKLAMPWDPVYLGRWLAFVKLLGARYGNSPAFRMIAAAGPTSVSEEMTLPADSPPAVKQWLGDGYTPAKYVGAWEKVFRVYEDSFPNQCISLAGPGIPMVGQGKSARDARVTATQDFIEKALKIFGRRLAIEANDLHAGHAKVEAGDQTAFINSYSGRIITGFEMRGASQGAGPSQVMGAAGNPPLALRKSVEKGMAVNPSGRHVNFLKIYQGDVVPADMQPVLQYAASLFGPPRR